MNRRDLIKGIVAATAAIKIANMSNNLTAKDLLPSKKTIKPYALKIGDKVGIIAPGTNVMDPDDISKAAEVIKWLGLLPVFGEGLSEQIGYKTRKAELRANDFNKMFADESIKAVFCVRGGYGSGQILKFIDFDLVKKNPKVFLGYSDITAMHQAINRFTGLITFHGPVLLSAYTNFTANALKPILFGEAQYPLVLTNPDGLSGIRKVFPMRTINKGKATGKLVGGNLSMVASLMGTKYEIETNDKILFLEDVGEAPFRIDRMLGQLSIAGKFDKVKGIVFGKCEDCDGNESTWDASLGEVLDYYFKPLNIPVFYGLLFGHSSNQLTIPINIQAELDATNQTLTLLESPVEII
jgi:muramoyltetrapeptide carboxypeptidase